MCEVAGYAKRFDGAASLCRRKGVVLVNRGWVPSYWKAEAQAAAAASREQRERGAETSAGSSSSSASSSKGDDKGWWGWLTGGRRGGGAAAAAAAPARAQPEQVVGVIQPDEQARVPQWFDPTFGAVPEALPALPASCCGR
jgi:hypothetical protein